jgi:DNA-binding beta-propeller fold protein YncE
MKRMLVVAAVVAANGAAALAIAAPPAAPAAGREVHSVALPGAPAGGVMMDFLALDKAHQRVWVPAGNTASVDVIEVGTEKVTRIEGFATKEVDRNGTKRTIGPSSAIVGDGVVYVGNRGDSSICAFDAVTLKKGGCVTVEGMPDALAYLPTAKELWVSTPRTNAIVILDVSKAAAPAVKQTFTTPGAPECFAVDDARGIVYTNLEDKDRTVAIDARTRKVTATWMPDCGEDGPKGLALDETANQLFVACPDRVRLLDAGAGGKVLATVVVGDGIDAIDYVASRHELYAGAARAGKMVIARLGPKGALSTIATVSTAPSARNAVAAEDGTAYLSDAHDGTILVVRPAK